MPMIPTDGIYTIDPDLVVFLHDGISVTFGKPSEPNRMYVLKRFDKKRKQDPLILFKYSHNCECVPMTPWDEERCREVYALLLDAIKGFTGDPTFDIVSRCLGKFKKDRTFDENIDRIKCESASVEI